MKRNKKNLMLIIFNLETGGAEMLVLELAKKINRDLFEVSVCSIENMGSLKEELAKSRINTFFLDKKPRGFDIKVIFRLIRILRKEKIDVIHTHNLFTLIYALPASLIAGTPIKVHTEHSYNYFITSRKRRLIAKILFKIVNKIIGVCDDVSNFLLDEMRTNPNKTFTILNGIDIDKFFIPECCSILKNKDKLGFKENDFIIGTIGRLERVKNHKLLILAFKEGLRIEKNLRLLIVGEGSLREELVKLTENLSISEYVKFTGNRKDIPDLLNIMDLFILPSLSEGHSIALLEAMAAKKPIIASDVGGNKEIIKNGINGILFSNFDEATIAKEILNLHNDEKKRKRIAEEAYNSVKIHFSLREMVRAYENIYR